MICDPVPNSTSSLMTVFPEMFTLGYRVTKSPMRASCPTVQSRLMITCFPIVMSTVKMAPAQIIVPSPIAIRSERMTLGSTSVMRSDRIAIGEGTIICAGAILTVDITIGKHVIINLDCTVGHDALIGDFVTLYPSVNISGNTVINDEVEFGTGSQIIQGKEVGSGSIIGAGAVVVRDIPQGCTAVGLPARPIKFHHVD